MTTEPEPLAEKIETGEYFREARRAYGDMYIEPLSDRYFLLVVMGFALVIMVIMLISWAMIYPLKPAVPFVYFSQDVTEELPRIKPLSNTLEEDPNLALKRYLVTQYVTLRENYNIDRLEENGRAVQQMSVPEVFDEWQKEMAPGNPESPIAQFQRHTIRKIRVTNVRFLDDGSADVEYNALMENVSSGDTKQIRMIANTAFRFTDVAVDQETGKATPLQFVVTGYHARRVQE